MPFNALFMSIPIFTKYKKSDTFDNIKTHMFDINNIIILYK
jgi:hypothetical protein